jgi:hypothetical protein
MSIPTGSRARAVGGRDLSEVGPVEGAPLLADAVTQPGSSGRSDGNSPSGTSPRGRVLGQAVGLLMGYYGIDAPGAHGLLNAWASARDVPLAELCAALVGGAASERPQAFSALCLELASEELPQPG